MIAKRSQPRRLPQTPHSGSDATHMKSSNRVEQSSRRDLCPALMIANRLVHIRQRRASGDDPVQRSGRSPFSLGKAPCVRVLDEVMTALQTRTSPAHSNEYNLNKSLNFIFPNQLNPKRTNRQLEKTDKHQQIISDDKTHNLKPSNFHAFRTLRTQHKKTN